MFFNVYIYCCCVSPGSPSPVTQQMTAMSISQDSGAVDSDRAEAEEGEEETSNNTGNFYRKQRPFLKSVPIHIKWVSLTAVEDSNY